MSIVTTYLRSWQTGEGRSIYSQTIVGAVIIWYLLTGDVDYSDQINEMLKHATNFKEIAEAYSSDAKNIAELIRAGELGAVLVYLFKLNAKLVDSRTELKKKGLENSTTE
ncbi:MAG: hypothetical protein DRO67_01250 [Candidatus Asgardarchaeum californiense]|nr:MAG: hypothetical protein DRO67_01250 [Candidatus Asgardarchaeum californiense]